MVTRDCLGSGDSKHGMFGENDFLKDDFGGSYPKVSDLGPV